MIPDPQLPIPNFPFPIPDSPFPIRYSPFPIPTRHRALSIYEKNPEISVVAKVEFPIGKKLFHLVVNPGTWRGARPWTWNWYKLREM